MDVNKCKYAGDAQAIPVPIYAEHHTIRRDNLVAEQANGYPADSLSAQFFKEPSPIYPLDHASTEGMSDLGPSLGTGWLHLFSSSPPNDDVTFDFSGADPAIAFPMDTQYVMFATSIVSILTSISSQATGQLGHILQECYKRKHDTVADVVAMFNYTLLFTFSTLLYAVPERPIMSWTFCMVECSHARVYVRGDTNYAVKLYNIAPRI